MIRGFLVAVTAAATLSPGALAAQEGCLALDAPSGGAGLAELTYAPDGLFRFTLPGAPFAVFSGVCALDGAESALCPIDCDGGSVSVTRTGDGIEMVFNPMRIEAVQVETLALGLAQFDADGLSVTGSYRLVPQPEAACAALSERVQPLSLAPGDYYPAVERIERALVLAGHYTDVPDWLYTEATAEAVRLFQAEAGLPVDGKADWALLSLLGVRVTYGLGGC